MGRLRGQKRASTCGASSAQPHGREKDVVYMIITEDTALQPPSFSPFATRTGHLRTPLCSCNYKFRVKQNVFNQCLLNELSQPVGMLFSQPTMVSLERASLAAAFLTHIHGSVHLCGCHCNCKRSYVCVHVVCSGYCSSFGVTCLVLHSLQWHVREPVHYGDLLCMQWY